MSLSDVFHERHWNPGYVYVAGSLSSRVLKIGTTKNILNQERYLRTRRYGGISDWVLLYYVWVEQGGRVEHDARHPLPRTVLRYEKDGRWQRAREIVQCDYSVALQSLTDHLSETERAEAWQSSRCNEFEFDRQEAELHRQRAIEANPQKTVTAPPIDQISYNQILLKRVDELLLSMRTTDCLRKDNIVYVGDLVQKTQAEMLRIPNFGRRSLIEINEVLGELELYLGMEFPHWSTVRPPTRPE